jgi:hypothetical protein
MLAVEHGSPEGYEQQPGTLISWLTYHIDDPLLNVLNSEANKEIMDASWCFPVDECKKSNSK